MLKINVNVDQLQMRSAKRKPARRLAPKAPIYRGNVARHRRALEARGRPCAPCSMLARGSMARTWGVLELVHPTSTAAASVLAEGQKSQLAIRADKVVSIGRASSSSFALSKELPWVSNTHFTLMCAAALRNRY
eukprot:661732-Pleurochrysis_carterae.AAC.6